jgi:hypothetical protein
LERLLAGFVCRSCPHGLAYLGIFAAALFAMLQVITILNRCHHFRGFVYQYARFAPDHQSIEIAGRLRKGSMPICSRCHQPAPIHPVGGPGFSAVLDAPRRLPPPAASAP